MSQLSNKTYEVFVLMAFATLAFVGSAYVRADGPQCERRGYPTARVRTEASLAPTPGAQHAARCRPEACALNCHIQAR